MSAAPCTTARIPGPDAAEDGRIRFKKCICESRGDKRFMVISFALVCICTLAIAEDHCTCGLQYSQPYCFVRFAAPARQLPLYPIIDRANSVSGLDHWRRHKTRHTADATGSVIIIQNHAARSLLLSVNCARCLRQFIIVELMHRKSFALEHEPPPMRLSSARLKLSGGKLYTLFLCRHCSSCSIISCCHATARGLISLLQCFRSVPRCQTCSRCSKAQ